MNTIKQVLVIWSLLLTIYPSITNGQQVQNSNSGIIQIEKSATAQTKIMMQQLSIDIAHYQALLEINYKYHLQADSIKNAQLEPQQREGAYMIIIDERNRALSVVLTTEQYEKFIMLQEERKNKAKAISQE